MSKLVVSYLVDLTTAPIDEVRRSRDVVSGPRHQVLAEARQPISRAGSGFNGIR